MEQSEEINDEGRKCPQCGNTLNDDEINASRYECFSCYGVED